MSSSNEDDPLKVDNIHSKTFFPDIRLMYSPIQNEVDNHSIATDHERSDSDELTRQGTNVSERETIGCEVQVIKTSQNASADRYPKGGNTFGGVHWDHNYSEVAEIQHKCEICDETFFALHEFSRHIVDLHSQGCDISPKASLSKGSENLSTITEAQSDDFKCAHCNICFESESVLSRHVKNHNVEELKESDPGEENREEDSDKPLKPPRGNFCVLCGDSFLSFSELEDHFDKHGNDVPLECPECADLYEDLNVFLDHMVEHAPKLRETFAKLQSEISEENSLLSVQNNPAEPSTLSEIPVEQESIETVSANMLSEERQETLVEQDEKVNSEIPLKRKEVNTLYQCEKCDKYFTSSSSLDYHISKHIRDKGYKCGLCDLSFLQFSDLSKHVSTHYAENPVHTCEDCGLSFAYKRSLKHHQVMHKKGKSKCKYCDAEFEVEPSLIQHLRKHEGNNPHLCPICQIPYVKKNDVLIHLKKVHQVNNEQKQCSICNKTFATPSEFYKHNLEHKKEKLYECDVCGKVLRHRNSFANHKLIHSDKRHQCAECGQAFVFSSNLKAHMRIHSGEKPYECSICSKVFARSAYLNEHMKTHSGKSDICCEYCGKEFSAASYFKHKKIHTGERPHKCDICDKGFIQMTHLHIHKRTHTGEKPHQCPICKKFYNRKDVLKKHLLLHKKKREKKLLAGSSDMERQEIDESSQNYKDLKIEILDIEDEQLLYSDMNFIEVN